MEFSKRLAAFGLGLMMVGSSAIGASAGNKEYSFYFKGFNDTKYSLYKPKDDDESNHYLTISSNNVSTSNVFGYKMHRRTDDNVDYYHTTTNNDKKTVSYTGSVKKYDRMRLAGQKDDKSKNSTVTTVKGKFCP
ncbi:hypothetical protein [Scatolibacter rhodanostii]|uniref:hypothetical protein n=1 Tax=Scatolibacter rhodanostii TaxID=2014781 RepID=UPI000C079F3E|nr:hypothetical protein [Scatolibacter rhodanostii]